MEIRLTFEEVKANHPDLIDILVEKMNSSRSKDKGKHPREYEWFYSYGITVKGMSFGEMIQDSFLGKNQEEKSTQEIINHQLNSVIGLSLVISSGSVIATRRYHNLDRQPRLFVEKFSEIARVGIQSRKQEEDRISKLSPEEKENEIKEHLSEFGFDEEQSEVILGKSDSREIEYDLDEILEKISKVGYEKLTAEEKEFLKDKSA